MEIVKIKINDLKPYCVYMHIFPNKKVYIGITKFKPEYRWNNGQGYKRQKYIYNAILKYGWDNIKHIILEENLGELEAKEKEKYYIHLFNSNDKIFGYNLTSGGDGTSDVIFTKKRIQKIIASNKKRIITDETKEKIRKARIGTKVSQETRKKMSENRKGKNNPFYGKHLNDEAKKKMSIANSGFNNKKSIHIGKYDLEYNLIEIYGSLREANKSGYNRRKFLNELNDIEFIEYGGYLWKKIN